MKRLLLLVLLSGGVAVAGQIDYTTPNVNDTVEMCLDKTAMQAKDFTNSVTSSGVDLVFTNAGASITSGTLTTVATNGVITIGRIGTLRLRLSGSMESITGAVDPMELRIHLDTGSGFVDTGFGVVRDISVNKHGSFAAEFHGVRAVGDKIKVVQYSDGTDTFVFNSISVMTEWMD